MLKGHGLEKFIKTKKQVDRKKTLVVTNKGDFEGSDAENDDELEY